MSKAPEIYLVCYNIRSLFNVGAMFRTADVFGVSKIYLCGYTGTPPRQEISKVALGAEEWIPWEQKKSALALIKQFKKQGVYVAALEVKKGATPLPKLKARFPLALVVGNEVGGLTPGVLKAADEVVAIPMIGEKESLNVAVAAGVALYALRNSSK